MNDQQSEADSEEEVLARVAWYYYHDGLTQNEIGDRLNLNRIKVSRLLEQGRRTGVIDVKINSRYQGCLMLEDGLRRHYGLADACVVPALSGGAESERLGQAAAQYLMQRLRQGDLLAAGWGATVSSAIQRLGHVANERNVGLVSMTGGVGTYVDGMRAAHWGSTVHLVPAPLVVRDPAVATALSTEPAVTNLLEMALDASYQLVGIGELSQSSTVVRSGYVSPSEIEPFRRKGAVGDILCRFFDESGQVLNLPFHDRVIGVKLEALAKSQKVVAAAGGPGKVPAIRAALLGRFASILITDEDTARSLLETAEGA